jgi:hypothetical protein
MPSRPQVDEETTRGPTHIVDWLGKRYEADALQATAMDDAELTKYGLGLGILFGRSGLTTLAAIVWLSRRQHGEPGLPYPAVANEVSLADPPVGAAANDDEPEPLGKD